MPQQASPWTSMLNTQPFLTEEEMLMAQNGMPPQDPYAVDPSLFMPPESEAAPRAQPAPQMMASNAPEPVSKSNYDDLVKRLNEKGIQSLALQSDGIKNLEAQRGAIDAIPRQTDLTPLSNLLDQWTGQNITKGYKKPLTPEERNAMMLSLETGIQKSREGLSGNEIELLKSQLGIEASRQASEDRAADRKLSREALNASKGLAAQDRKDKMILGAKQDLIKTKQAGQLDGAIAFSSALDRYEDLVRKYGIDPTGEGADLLNSAYSDLQTSYKEAKNLGALSGPDMGILHNAVGPAGDFKTYFTSKFRGDKKGMIGAIENIRGAGKRDFDRNYNVLKSAYGEIGDDVLGEYKKQYSAVRQAKPQDLTAENKPMTREEKIAKLKGRGK